MQHSQYCFVASLQIRFKNQRRLRLCREVQPDRNTIHFTTPIQHISTHISSQSFYSAHFSVSAFVWGRRITDIWRRVNASRYYSCAMLRKVLPWHYNGVVLDSIANGLEWARQWNFSSITFLRFARLFLLLPATTNKLHSSCCLLLFPKLRRVYVLIAPLGLNITAKFFQLRGSHFGSICLAVLFVTDRAKPGFSMEP